jgi:hypothetical protein
MFPNAGNPVAGSFVAEQVKEIRSRCDVTVIAPVPLVLRPMRKLKPRWDAFWNTPFHHAIEDVEVYRPRYFCLPKNASLLLDGLFYGAAIANIVERIYRESPLDLLHVHGAVPDGGGVLLTNRKYKLPVVVTIHGRDMNTTVHMSGWHRRLVGRVLSSADRVIVVSSKLKREILELFPHVREPIVIHNGIDTTLFSPAASETARTRPNGEHHVLIVGNLVPSKNHKAVISAVARLGAIYPGIRLKIGGSGPEEKRLRLLCQKLRVSDRVEFLGLCSRERVKQLMSECDIFVMPSYDEGFGIVYIEAMSQGKPVIGSRGEGIADVITEGETGFLVDPHNVDELTEKIRLLLDNGDLAEEVGRNARELVFREFTWKRNFDRLMEVYQQLGAQT